MDGDIKERWQIDSYPGIVFFNEDRKVRYHGNKEKSDILEWFKKEVGPSHQLINDCLELKRRVTEAPLSVTYISK